MPITNDCQVVPIAKIWIDRDNRQRRVVETKGLENSISKRGVLQPIVIERGGDYPAGFDYKLVAGERRLTACVNLSKSTIIARFADQLPKTEAELIELEENVHRQDLDWIDAAQSVARIHQLHLAMDEEWTMYDTADAVSMSQGTVSMYIRVHRELEAKNPRVCEAGTVREAYNTILRAEQRAMGNELEELMALPVPSQQSNSVSGAMPMPTAETLPLGSPRPLPQKPAKPAGPSPVDQCILHTSFLDWAPQYTGQRFNLVHCDFPYGANFHSGPQGRGAEPDEHYSDKESDYWDLLNAFCENLDKFMAASAHLMFWMSADSHIVWQTLEVFRQKAPSLRFAKFPLIWGKTDNDGISSDAKRSARHTYELCLLATRGDRHLVQVKADFYPGPTNHQLHPSTKPVPMLKHFMTMLVDEHTQLLDPTCGSGAALRAAEALGAKRVLGLEALEQYVIPARKALGSDRTLRAMSGEL